MLPLRFRGISMLKDMPAAEDGVIRLVRDIELHWFSSTSTSSETHKTQWAITGHMGQGDLISIVSTSLHSLAAWHLVLSDCTFSDVSPKHDDCSYKELRNSPGELLLPDSICHTSPLTRPYISQHFSRNSVTKEETEHYLLILGKLTLWRCTGHKTFTLWKHGK